MKSDIEIEEAIKPKNIDLIAKKYGIQNKYLINYGKYIAKVDLDVFKSKINKQNGKLILVTSINPTPYGEGKTTMAIGLCDALNKLGEKTVVALREPSMGPVFGIKGGATGGGYSQVMPMSEINLNFTGDMHALTAANNLLCAIIDNHIFQGNELNIKRVVIPRCLDINDRALRSINIKTKGCEREDSFIITVATELMAILCLSKDLQDLKRRISKIIIGYNDNNKPVFVYDLKAEDALAIILKDAINPNIVQTLEHNLAIIHGGPFANIAHGCNSIIATNLALKLGNYVVTEAGFGADLGAEKFLDITSEKGGFQPDTIVINATVRALKHNGNGDIKSGICNLKVHIDNMKLFTNNIIVCLNKFQDDTYDDLSYIINYCNDLNIKAIINDTYFKGSNGGIELAKEIVKITKNKSQVNKLYSNDDSIENKIMAIVKNIYHAKQVIYSQDAINNIAEIENLGLDKYPICIAKTQYSISDDKNLLGSPSDYDFHINKVYVNNGAEFIVAEAGNTLRMPGLGKSSAYLSMKISDEKKIRGLF